MKQKFVPLSKQSKRKRKEHHASSRKDWGTVSPVTKKLPNAKAYCRKKSKQRYEHEPGLDFFVIRSPDPLSAAFANQCDTKLTAKHAPR